jgi:hypothetical protein
MLNIKELYRKNAYGVMGTLIFHILLVSGFLISEFNIEGEIKKEEAILLDFTAPKEEKVQEEEKVEEKKATSESSPVKQQSAGSNRAVNDALKRDKFFDANYNRDIEEAKKLVSDVNKQLSKKVQQAKKFEMPAATTEGQNPDSIKNTVYSGKSNIHYFLENRYHLRLPIPVYLAKKGVTVIVDIQVDRTGKVIKAEPRPSRNLNDPMLPVYARQAAEETVFNSEPKAPAIQKGTITYNFVAQ